MPQIGRLWRTIRYLKWRQVIGRARFRLVRPPLSLSSTTGLRQPEGRWVRPAQRKASLIGPDAFRFLGESGSLEELGWDGEERSKLWRYNQHYFDDLNAAGSQGRRHWHTKLIDRWILENPPTAGSGWEPYPTSLRIVNWIKFALDGNQLPDRVQQSLAIQARWLSKRLEWHLLGNHLFANAKALVFAGLFFDGYEACGWLATGLKILNEELEEQVLTDGAQFELSPMYHALAVEDILDLINVFRAYSRIGLAQDFAYRMPAMLRWLFTMSHPDGDIAFFNDAAIGVAPDNAELNRYAQELGFVVEPPADGITHQAHSGYVRMALGPAVVLADVACVGPDYLPGHAHADTLSFELSLLGKRLIVNSGTSEYGSGPERQRQRGSAAHSTLLLNNENSSEVWSGFRVGRRAKPFDVAVWQDGGSLVVTGAHDGYTHLPGRPVHRREWRLSEGGLLVEDTVEGSGIHRIDVYFHLAPYIDAIFDIRKNNIYLSTLDKSWHGSFLADCGIVQILPSSWHPEFGRRIETAVICVSIQQPLPQTVRCELKWRIS